MKHPHIALTGLARSGKDTVAGYLEHRYGYTHLALADEVREAALRTDPIIIPDDERDDWGSDHMRLAELVSGHGWEYAKTNPEVRQYLQRFGQSMRDVDPRIWIRPVLTQVLNATAHDTPCVISDLRYLNEVDELQRHGALTVRIVRPDSGLRGVSAAHVSETELADTETAHTLHNDRHYPHLFSQVDSLLGRI
ncbi:hypothetical protein LHJ74_30750 [Streptomyces sp. N2-109]|uniref:DNMP kinase n=1 Tax=Streptomyces gossypii TaxID=2883101 RepID=A0ABT2K2M8_9ACTN|nr:hypothetical protein [Streptomyces gossypii]MCT2594236.1 hypothetical protein [Streptomyces gossypii]